MPLLILIQLVHRPITTSHPVIPISHALPQNLLVKLFHVRRFRNGNHIVAPRKTNEALYAPFLMTAIGITETRLKTVVSLELDECLLLNTILAA